MSKYLKNNHYFRLTFKTSLRLITWRLWSHRNHFLNMAPFPLPPYIARFSFLALFIPLHYHSKSCLLFTPEFISSTVNFQLIPNQMVSDKSTPVTDQHCWRPQKNLSRVKFNGLLLSSLMLWIVCYNWHCFQIFFFDVLFPWCQELEAGGLLSDYLYPKFFGLGFWGLGVGQEKGSASCDNRSCVYLPQALKSAHGPHLQLHTRLPDHKDMHTYSTALHCHDSSLASLSHPLSPPI